MKTYISGLNGISQLGELPQDLKNLIKQNKNSISNTLKRAEKLNGLGHLPQGKHQMMNFSEVVKQYNTGISEDEIKAWVWYRRNLGIPMYGWEKYYIDGGGSEQKILIAKQETTVKDNHFRDIETVPKGAILGKLLSKSHTYDKITYRFYRCSHGIRMVNSEHCQEQDNLKTDQKKLDKLVIAGALFYLKEELLPYPVYAYGNMYERTQDLKEDKDHIIKSYGIEVYALHEKVIKESMPMLLTVTNPDAKQRPKISALSRFAMNQEEGFDVSVDSLKDETGIIFKSKLSLHSAFTEWLNKLDRNDFEESSAYNIIMYYLNGRNMPRNSTAEEKAELRRTTRNEGEKLFERFLHEALKFEDQQRLDYTWNRLYNGISSIAYHKIPIGFKCSAIFQGFDFEIRPVQREAIAFAELTGSACIAYDVGLGKTIAAIIELANSIQSGKCKRPFIVVPNQTYANWITELIGKKDNKGRYLEGVLTGTGITLNEWYNLGTDIIDKINLNKPVPEKSITLLTYEGFKKIGFGKSIAQELMYELTNILMQAADLTGRDEEIEYQKILEKVGIGLKDTIADIDVLGFDYGIWDEAHNCNKVFGSVKKDRNGRKRFGMSGQMSDLGIKTFFLTNYIQRKFGRNILLLSATPFTNNPLEIYSFLSFVAYHSLKEMNLDSINDFFELFVHETTEDVVGYNGQISQRDVIKSFTNKLLLQRLIYNHINYKTGEEAGVKRPKKINLPKVNENKDGIIYRLPPNEQILTYLKMTLRQQENQKKIVGYMNQVSTSRVLVKAGELLRALNFSLNNAVHPCLFDNIEPKDYKDFVNESPKIKYACECIRTVRDYHLNRHEPISGQIIYLNRGKDYFQFIKEYLEKEVGYKTGVKYGKYTIDEIELINSDVSQVKKNRIKDAFLDGICKVIIGTESIVEGLNLQKKGTVLYNLFPDWNPTAIRQVEGRIWRQKNEFAFVRINMPLLQDSMDVFVFQKLEEKTYRINDLWFKGDRGNVLDLESLDPEEVKFALLSDLEAIVNSIIKKEVTIQERKIRAISNSIETLGEYNRWKATYKNYKDRLLRSMQRFFDQMKELSHIKFKPDKEDLKVLSKEDQQRIIKDIEFFEEATRFFENLPDDKAFIAMAKRFSRTFPYFDNYAITNFVEALSIVSKAEKTLLASKGFTAEDDINKVIASYKNDLTEANNHLRYLKSEEYRFKKINEVRLQKEELAIVGKSVKERVEEFANLNYLLSYKFADLPADGRIPKKEKDTQRKAIPWTTSKDENEDEEILLAMAELELLNLNF